METFGTPVYFATYHLECDANFSTIISIPPKESKTIIFDFYTSTSEDNKTKKLKVGHYLIKAPKGAHPFDGDEYIRKGTQDKRNIIWSNTIEM